MLERGHQLPSGSHAVAILSTRYGNEHGVWRVDVAALAPVALEVEGNVLEAAIFKHKLRSVIRRSHDEQKVFASHDFFNSVRAQDASSGTAHNTPLEGVFHTVTKVSLLLTDTSDYHAWQMWSGGF
jgi:hypothetical protein